MELQRDRVRRHTCSRRWGQRTIIRQASAQPNESKVLGLAWDKRLDTLTMTFFQNDTPTTKREVLRTLAKVYNPLRLATRLTLQGKLIYREICDQKLP